MRTAAAASAKASPSTNSVRSSWACSKKKKQQLKQTKQQSGNVQPFMRKRRIYIGQGDHKLKLIILDPKKRKGKIPGILWIHGGGYMVGMAAMVDFSCGKMLGKRYEAVVVSPGYRLAFQAPYPAALEDCYAALEYMWDHADELGIDRDKIIVG
ncbi:MAG: alpha/beta hydrolase fold domain-containing protein, partial [Erysipelotrichaceae bacterium]|nr:alpha/beta hydrolase fold domain-containing protein [Erysipelotrichaceae bacterium]